VDLADVLARLRIIDVHVHQRDGPALEKRFLQHTRSRSRLVRATASFPSRKWPIHRSASLLSAPPPPRDCPVLPGHRVPTWNAGRMDRNGGGKVGYLVPPEARCRIAPPRIRRSSAPSQDYLVISGDVSQLSSSSHRCPDRA